MRQFEYVSMRGIIISACDIMTIEIGRSFFVSACDGCALVYNDRDDCFYRGDR